MIKPFLWTIILVTSLFGFSSIFARPLIECPPYTDIQQKSQYIMSAHLNIVSKRYWVHSHSVIDYSKMGWRIEVTNIAATSKEDALAIGRRIAVTVKSGDLYATYNGKYVCNYMPGAVRATSTGVL